MLILAMAARLGLWFNIFILSILGYLRLLIFVILGYFISGKLRNK